MWIEKALFWSMVIAEGLLMFGLALVISHNVCIEREISANHYLIQSLYYTIGEQEIACDEAIKAAQVSCVD